MPPTQHPLCDIDPRPHTMREIASHSAGASKHQASKQATSAPRRRPQPRCDSAAAAPSRSLGTSCRAAEMGSRDAIMGDLCIAVGTDPGADRCITIVMHGGMDRASFRFLGLRRVLLRVPTHCTYGRLVIELRPKLAHNQRPARPLTPRFCARSKPRPTLRSRGRGRSSVARAQNSCCEGPEHGAARWAAIRRLSDDSTPPRKK